MNYQIKNPANAVPSKGESNSGVSLTVPDLSMPISEIVRRFVRKGEIPGVLASDDADDDLLFETDMGNPQDLADREEAGIEAAERMAGYRESYKAAKEAEMQKRVEKQAQKYREQELDLQEKPAKKPKNRPQDEESEA